MIFRFLLALAIAAAPFLAPEAHAADKVAVGLVVALAQAPYYVALEKGYFADDGIAIESDTFRGAADMTAALATGQLDVGMGALNDGFFNAANRGLDLRVVAAMGYQPHPVIATPPLVRKDLWDSGAIRSGKDLRGRKVGVTPGSTPEFDLSLILEKYGMTLKDVDETVLSFPDMVLALDHKSLDVGFIAAPFHAIPLRDGTAVLLKPEAGVTAGDLTTVIFFSGKFLHDRPEVGARFLAAVMRGAKETQGAYNKNPAIAALLAKATGLKLQDIEDSIAFAIAPTLDIRKFEASIRRQEAQHRKDGRLDYQTPIALDKIIDTKPLEAALAQK